MPDQVGLGRAELLIRSRPPGNIWTIPALALLLSFGVSAIRQDGWIFKAIGVVLLVCVLLGAIGFFVRVHQRIVLHERALLLYETYPSRTPDQQVALDELRAVRIERPEPQSYRLSFTREQAAPIEFTLAPIRSADAPKIGQLIERLRARGIRVQSDAATPAGSSGTLADGTGE